MLMINHLSSLEFGKDTPPKIFMGTTCESVLVFSRNYDVVALYELLKLEHGTPCILPRWKIKKI
jgi:hypothetical protein